jgi:hypothetical protein
MRCNTGFKRATRLSVAELPLESSEQKVEGSFGRFGRVAQRVLASMQRLKLHSTSRGRHLRAALADKLGSGAWFRRASRHDGFERQHVGYQHTPRANVQQLADTKARALRTSLASCTVIVPAASAIMGPNLLCRVWLQPRSCLAFLSLCSPTICARRHAERRPPTTTARRLVHGGKSSVRSRG